MGEKYCRLLRLNSVMNNFVIKVVKLKKKEIRKKYSVTGE